MVESTFKTMYLVSKSDLDNKEKSNFKLSLQNKDICDGGMNVSVKPIKTRMRNKPQTKKTSNPYLDNISENEDDDNPTLAGKREQLNIYSRPAVRTVGTNTAANQQHEKDDINKENTAQYKQQNLSYEFRSRKRKHENYDDDDDENDGKKENSGISSGNSISSDEGYEILRHRLKRLQGSKTNNYKETLSTNQEREGISHDTEPSIQKIPPVSKDEIGSVFKDTDIQMRNMKEKHKMEELDNTNKNEKQLTLKKRTILHDIQKLKDDQWLGRIKSRLNDKRVQFKRKRDTIGYRINPDDITDQRERMKQTTTNNDISKSLIKPSDFTYLNQAESADFLDKWKPLKELRKKYFTNKRFKKYH